MDGSSTPAEFIDVVSAIRDSVAALRTAFATRHADTRIYYASNRSGRVVRTRYFWPT